MSNILSGMKPGQILKAIRNEDLAVIKILVKEGVKRKIWTQAEVAEMVNKDIATISRWVNNAN